MAPKKPLSDKHPSPPEPEEDEESSEEEEESSQEEEEESEVEEEKNNAKTPLIPQNSELNKNPNVQKQITPPPQSPSDSGEEEEEEDEEDEEGEEEALHSPSASDFLMKPITPTKPTSKDSKPTSKRPSEAQKDDEKDAGIKKKAKVIDDELKKEKIAAVSSVSAASGGGAGRVWSEEDIIGLLQGMIDYKDEKGTDPSADMGAFYDFVKGKLQIEFSKTQIYEKVRRLRMKYFNYVEKSEKGGEDPVFSKPHESEAFDLSKKIWGGGSGDGMISNGVDENVHGKSNNNKNGKVKKSGKVVSSVDTVKEDKNKKNVVKELDTAKEDKNKKNVVKELARDGDEGDFESKYPFLSQSLDVDVGRSIMFAGERSFLKENMSLIGNAKAKELEGKWKKLREAEAEVLLEKLDLMKEHTKLVLEGMKEK